MCSKDNFNFAKGLLDINICLTNFCQGSNSLSNILFLHSIFPCFFLDRGLSPYAQKVFATHIRDFNAKKIADDP
jgi:hypothetical protein